jgi:hypothetical protein
MSERKYPTRDSGPMYNFPMPTETLRGQLTEAHAMIDAALALHPQEHYLINTIVMPPTRHYGCFTCKSDGVCDTAKALGVTDDA